MSKALSPAEAARIAGVTKKLILDACRRGDLKSRKFGHRTIRILPEWLQGYLDQVTR